VGGKALRAKETDVLGGAGKKKTQNFPTLKSQKGARVEKRKKKRGEKGRNPGGVGPLWNRQKNAREIKVWSNGGGERKDTHREGAGPNEEVQVECYRLAEKPQAFGLAPKTVLTNETCAKKIKTSSVAGRGNSQKETGGEK